MKIRHRFLKVNRKNYMKYLKEAAEIPIGQKLKLKRRELKMTQKDLATSVGVTFQQLQKYETGQSKISIEMLLNLCKVLKVNFDYFLPKTTVSLSLKEKQENKLESYDLVILEKKLIEMFRLANDINIKISILKIVEIIIKAARDNNEKTPCKLGEDYIEDM